MTGKQLIDAIQKYHLEDLNIFSADTVICFGIIIEFDNGDIELPYPECKDFHLDKPAHIYKYKVLEVDDDGNSRCYDKELYSSIHS